MHRYRLAGEGVVEGGQRSCLYLQPQEERFFAAGGHHQGADGSVHCLQRSGSSQPAAGGEKRAGVAKKGSRPVLTLRPAPRGSLFLPAGGWAVAVYDYRFTMRRLPAPEDAPWAAAACVQTPKAVWQCV